MAGKLPATAGGRVFWEDVVETLDFGDPVVFVPAEPSAPPKVRKARVFDLEDTEEL